MLHTKVRLVALAGCAVGVLGLASCGVRQPVEAPPAAAGPGYGDSTTPELMGAPSAAGASPADGLLGGPAAEPSAGAPALVADDNPALDTWRRPDGTLVTAMAPIPNPEAPPHRTIHDAPPAVASPARRTQLASAPVARPVARPAVKRAVAVKPAAKPQPLPSPVAKPAPRPVAVAPAPAPLKPIVAAQPAAPLAKAPIVAPIAPAAAQAQPAKPLSKLQQLQAAVASEATSGAVLASGESLAQGKEGQVTLSLPASLGDRIRKEAAALGLAPAGAKTTAYADLRGEGYEIMPNGRQTAVLKSDQPATFAWQVKPTPAAKGPLKTEFGVELNGVKPVQAFSLGSIAKQIAPIQDAVTAKTSGFNLAAPSFGRYETIDLPGIGKTPSKSILGAALLLLALAILVIISRNASAAKASTERRRKFHTPGEATDGSSVNPVVATAGGALAGAAVASAVGHRDDQTREEYAPFETPLDANHGAPPTNAEAAPPSAQDHAGASAADQGKNARGPGGDKELEHTH